MNNPKPLDYQLLRRKTNLAQLNFKTTDQLKILSSFIGQERALHALKFGIGIKSNGYNLYAMGPSGIGKISLIKHFLNKHTDKHRVPSDWCYIHHFAIPEKPIALEMPAGQGHIFQQDIKKLVDQFAIDIVSAFESNEYQIKSEKIKKLYEKNKAKFDKKNHQFLLENMVQLHKKQQLKINKLEAATVYTVIQPMINKLKKKYKKYEVIKNYLDSMQEDIINNSTNLVKQDEKNNVFYFCYDDPILINYKVNLLVDNNQLQGEPIIFEEAPSYSSLISRVEHASQAGILTTNFALIKAGSLHRANGGYLIIEARKIRKNREAWESLKTALFSKRINIKPLEDGGDSVKPVSLEPEPIPLNVKVILVGDRNTYYSLCQHDPDFLELFKVPVDFDEEMVRTTRNVQLYARLIASIVQRKSLLPLHVSAVAEIIDYSSRLAEDNEKMSMHIRYIDDLIVESAYWAQVQHKKVVEAQDVKQALSSQIHRMDRARDLYYEDIKREFIIINTTEQLIGQVNCLSVRRVGNFSYGHPTRVTARVRLGEGKVIDIQREVKLAGPLHSKAGLIIANYLASQFNKNKPFSLFASLAFEQLYCWTDGDSASVGELCAILSALAEVPLNQFMAVTGSIDQHGMVQAIGGVNEKIEGFYDVCQARKLTGRQGVIIPAINIKNLMLREDIVEATRLKKFFVYPVSTVDEALQLLINREISEPNQLSKETIYTKIENRLQQFTNNRLRKS